MEDIFKQLLNRPLDSNKYDYGHVLIIGGAPGMVGAPMIAASAALRVGAGLVSIASSSEVIDKIEGQILELMTHRIDTNAPEKLIDYINRRKVSVIVIGPGTTPDMNHKIMESLSKLDLPVIVDGGALGTIARQPELISDNFILTPHKGEFSRFFNEPLPDDKSELINKAKEFAVNYQIILVQKGQPTLVFNKSGEMYQNTNGGPALASGGTGDMLTGLIAGIIAQKIEPYKAAQAGVYLGGMASDIAAQWLSVVSVLASDIIKAVPEALKKL